MAGLEGRRRAPGVIPPSIGGRAWDVVVVEGDVPGEVEAPDRDLVRGRRDVAQQQGAVECHRRDRPELETIVARHLSGEVWETQWRWVPGR